MEETRYHYSAKVIDVHDGDTITCDLDLGFGILLKAQKFRFFGINTPELHGENEVAGKASREFVAERLLDKYIIIETFMDKKEKFGRWLAKIHYKVDNDWINLNKEMIDNKMAIVFMADETDI
jgi:micrococcal nuclease